MALDAAIIEQLPEDIRSNPVVQRFNDLPSVFKSVIDANSYQGRSIALPGDNDTPEQIEAWKTNHMPKLNKVLADRLPPSKADEYEFKFDGVDNEAIKSDKLLGLFRENAHKLGLSKSQAAGLVEVFGKDILPALVPQVQQQPKLDYIESEAEVKSLAAEVFGKETTQRLDEYKKGVDILSRDNPQLKDILNEAVAPYGQRYMSLGDHPAMIRLISDIGRLTAPDYIGSEVKGETRTAAQDEIKDIMNNPQNPKHALWKAGDRSTREYMDELFRQANGGR